ncbi:unnamed protein product [Cladocopium goreaui]|uniref:Protein sel-1-like 2 n=1 Tax=Cladocopium goreaui TaxID=2562237 RepID=A0A9P1GN06_9DINO|nr:unnamed protein product [Cladocopium goreaui]|mmetsp:Transcript_64774/g.142013  ORF Transcript_64774/g.142013 Transcript_64774/m.142013 type:complete len:246 (-) Transcript_64774:94-831(-)
MAWMARLEESGTIAGRFQRRSARNAWLAVPLLLCAAQAFVSGATSWQASRRHGRIARHGVEELYAEGMSCLKSGSDLARGVRCMQEASEKGFAPADTVLGSAYAEGMFGVPRDLDQAKYYLERGAEGGDNRAHFNLGILKLRGKNGFPQDKRAAATHFRIAGEAGHHDALMNLSRMFATGDGIPQDSQQAAQCIIKAAQAGDQMKELLQKISEGTLDPSTTTKLQEEMDRIRDRAQQMPGFMPGG